MKICVYTRVSTKDQAEKGVSLEAQREKAALYAKLHDLEVVEVVEDDGYSAKTLDRPGLKRALSLLETGTAGALLIVKLDRLTRSVGDLGLLVERYFSDGRFNLLSVAEHVDTRSAAGRLVLNVLASVAQWEREAIGERTRDALAHLKSAGVRLGGEALGWERSEELDQEGRRIVREVPAERETMERIRELHAGGASLRKIACALNSEGRPSKRGGAWQPSAVLYVIRRLRSA